MVFQVFMVFIVFIVFMIFMVFVVFVMFFGFFYCFSGLSAFRDGFWFFELISQFWVEGPTLYISKF